MSYDGPSIGERPRVAYFCMEFGLDEKLPIYSGGLGVLAGDHLKSASDLGLPLVGVSLMYREGYFRQYLNVDGWQQERYPENDFFSLPLIPELNPDGTPVAQLSVSDTGIGIPAGEQGRLFTRFFRASTAKRSAVAGVGLGLSITKAITTAHGGALDLASAEGQGTTFTLTLPLPA